MTLEQQLTVISVVTRIGKLEGRGDPVRAARHAVWLLHRMGFRVVAA